MSTKTINISRPEITIDIIDSEPVLNFGVNDINLDIQSGGIVPALIDTTLVASESISALRCITTNASGLAKYANNDTIANAMVIGISITAGNIGENITIKTSGLMTDQSWNWSKGLVFLGTNGTLTQTAPTNGLIMCPVARAITSTTIIIDIETTITTV